MLKAWKAQIIQYFTKHSKRNAVIFHKSKYKMSFN